MNFIDWIIKSGRASCVISGSVKPQRSSPRTTPPFRLMHQSFSTYESFTFNAMWVNPLNVLLWMTLLAWFYEHIVFWVCLCLFVELEFGYTFLATLNKQFMESNKLRSKRSKSFSFCALEKTKCIHEKQTKREKDGMTPWWVSFRSGTHFKLDSIDLVKYSISFGHPFMSSPRFVASLILPILSISKMHWVEKRCTAP